MKLVCLKCGYIDNEYEGGYLYNGEQCNHRFIPIDDLMVESMIILNRKGYKTLFCCQGHPYEGVNLGHVCFELPIFIDENIPVPKHSYLDSDDSRVIRANKNKYLEELSSEESKFNANDPKTSIELLKSTTDFCISILEWAYNLPEFNRKEFIDSDIYQKYVRRKYYCDYDETECTVEVNKTSDTLDFYQGFIDASDLNR